MLPLEFHVMVTKMISLRTRQSTASLLPISWLLVGFVYFSSPSTSLSAQTATEKLIPTETVPKKLDGNDGRELLLRNFRPQSTLKVKQTLLRRARFPVIDVHSHFRIRLRHSPDKLDDYVAVMNRNNIAVCLSLDAQLGDAIDEHQKYLWEKYENRFLVFSNIDWIGDGDREDPQTWRCQQEGFVREMVEGLRDAKKRGVSGLKIFKQLGLGYRNSNGDLIQIDSPRWDPIWRVCGELQLPVIMHVADPAAFFMKIDPTNERWEELSRHPEWSFPADKFPSREALLEARNRVIARHPQTIFIGAHVANNAEDLAQVSQWLIQYPNLYVELASRIGELGRQPYTARKFIIRHSNRILFGTDGPWPALRLSYYLRFLEAYDEKFLSSR